MEVASNEGDLEGFRVLEIGQFAFRGKQWPSRGWVTTLSNYRTSYPDRTAMGTPTFGVKSLPAGQDHALMLGSWRLERTGGLDTLSGWFSLVWQKGDGDWVIIRDHSS